VPSSVRPNREIPARFREKALDGFDPSVSSSAAKALAAARRWAAGEITSLVLIGAAGVGKTHLGAALLNAAGKGLWQNVAELIVGMRADINRASDDKLFQFRPNELRRYAGPLVLDDLGRERISDWTGETVYTLVNARYEERYPTIVTSNLSARNLQTNGYWPAISRLAEDGELVEITAPDYRLRRPVLPIFGTNTDGPGSPPEARLS
jgi:DNA replication protein DnaC